MNKNWYKIISFVITLVISLQMILVYTPVDTLAADVITSTVNISEAKKNERGPGYNWANRTDTLTLDGLNINTESPFGLRLPKNCTVILKGDNYIKASKYGVSCLGTVVFKGNGTLTIDAGEIGIYLISQDFTQKIRLIGGNYNITAGKYGVYSDYADFSFVGKRMSINVTSDDGSAICGRIVNLLGGSFTANSTVESTHSLTVDSINIDVTSNRSALLSKNLDLDNLSVETFDGETEFSAKSTAKSAHRSIIFGEKVPGFVDYIILAILIVGVTMGIFGPALRKKKKNKELYERLKQEGYID